MRGVGVTALLPVLLTVVVPSVFGYYGDGWEKEHTGAQVWRVQMPTAHQGEVVQRMSEELDILHLSDTEATVHVRSQCFKQAKQLVKEYNLTTEVTVEDLARYLKDQHLHEEFQAQTRAIETCTATLCPKPFLSSYMTFQQIEWFLQSLAAQNPNNVKLSVQGKSTQNRTLWLVKVFNATGAAGAAPKAVFVEGGIHAREWITPAVVLNIIMAQVTACKNGIACNATFYFMPVLNPDGYVYSWTTNRMWRKNRSLPPQSSTQYGTDLNRNFGYSWGTTGSSGNPGAETYRGTSAFSSPEATAERNALQAIINSTNSGVALYVAYHSYSQLIMYPWGYSSSVVPPSRTKNINAGMLYRAALKKIANKDYKVVNSASGLYLASGISTDYAMSLGIQQAFTVEMRDTGTYGFSLPMSQINATFQENWAGFKAMVNYTLL